MPIVLVNNEPIVRVPPSGRTQLGHPGGIRRLMRRESGLQLTALTYRRNKQMLNKQMLQAEQSPVNKYNIGTLVEKDSVVSWIFTCIVSCFTLRDYIFMFFRHLVD